MGQVAGTSPLKGFTRGDLLHIEITKFRRLHRNLGKRRDEKGVVLNSETEVTKF